MPEPLRLLLVEDSEDDAVLIETVLRQGGYDLRTARVADGEHLRRALASSSWDLLITEHTLGALDAVEVLRIVGQADVDLRAILVSGKVGEEAVVEAVRAGAREYVAKDDLARLGPVVRRELEEKVSRQERRAAQAKYEVAFRSSPDSLSLTSFAEGRFLEVNRGFEQITGYGREEALGRTTLELGIWSDPEQRIEFLRALEEEGSVRDRRLRLCAKDGRRLETLVSAEIINLPEGRTVLSVVRDVTEEVRTREALELSEERFSKAFYANPNPAVITTLSDGTILEVNEGLCRIAGRRAEELLGRNGIELDLWDSGHATRMYRLLTEHGAASDVALRVRGATGGFHDLLVSAVVVEMAGEPCVLNVAVDITERNRLQTHLLRAQRLESIGTLAGGIAHDLNNVLTPILTAIKLLRRGRAHQRERVLSILESNARRGADLIRQLLTFSRGADGRRIPVDLADLVGEVATIVGESFSRGIDVGVDLDDDLWTVQGDPTQFHQVLLNLAVNARDAMEGEGELRIAARNRTFGEGDVPPGSLPGRYVELEVSDSGPGIPVELRRQVFDPFFTTKDPGHGTGLGLFTAETIVSAHGGFIGIADAPTGGARFKVCLPVAGGRGGEGIERHSLVPASEGSGELVLIVDDDASVREIVAGVLEASGYRTLPAADGRIALERFEERRTEVRAVVVEMRMPGMDGGATIRALRHREPDLPILATSGGEDDAERSALVAGADVFLSKPLTAEELLAGLRRALGRERTAAGPLGREAS